MKRCQKPKTSYSQRNSVENSKGLSTHCETVKNPLGGASQRNDVENPKGLSLRNGQKPVRGCLAAKRCRKPKTPLAAKRPKTR